MKYSSLILTLKKTKKQLTDLIIFFSVHGSISVCNQHCSEQSLNDQPASPLKSHEGTDAWSGRISDNSVSNYHIDNSL